LNKVENCLTSVNVKLKQYKKICCHKLLIIVDSVAEIQHWVLKNSQCWHCIVIMITGNGSGCYFCFFVFLLNVHHVEVYGCVCLCE